MRKLIFSAFLVTTATAVFAQDLDDVQDKISKNKLPEAQEKIDKILANPKYQKNANAWYYKGIVYNGLAMDSSKTDRDYRAEAYDALQKYYELDPKNVMGALEQNARLFQVYEGYYNAALKDYNANNFVGSYKNFAKALATEQYIQQKGFSYGNVTFPALDTSLILNVAATALKAKMEDSAMMYYQRLADAKIKTDNFIEIYQTLVDYYGRKNDAANRDKYLALGKELYPTSDYWFEADLSGIRDDKPKLLAKYAELTQANPNSYYLNYNYAVELFNYLYANDKKPADAASYESLVEPAIANAIKANNTPDANLLMVRYMSEKIYRQEDAVRAVKGTKPEDVNKRKALNAQITKMWDAMAPYAEAAFTGYTEKKEMKAFEKGNFKFVSNVLIDYYNMKKQADKAKMYQDKMKELGL